MEIMMRTIVGVDIDGTLAYGSHTAVWQLCNKQLALSITEDVLATVTTMRAFWDLPEVRAYRRRVGSDLAARELQHLELHPDILRGLQAYPGAQPAVRHLWNALGPVSYYTARYLPNEEQFNEGCRAGTQDWLQTQGFIKPDRAVFCDKPRGKLQKLAEDMAAQSASAVLIDDQYQRLLDAYRELENESQQILRRGLILVAFRAKTPIESAPMPVVMLSSWRKPLVEQAIVEIQQQSARMVV
jgi:hypothetical protein